MHTRYVPSVANQGKNVKRAENGKRLCADDDVNTASGCKLRQATNTNTHSTDPWISQRLVTALTIVSTHY